MACDVDGAKHDASVDVGTTDEGKDETPIVEGGDEDKLSRYVRKTSCAESDIREKPIKG